MVAGSRPRYRRRRVWLVVVPFAATLTLWKPKARGWPKIVHVMLFLCTGVAAGMATAMLLNGDLSPWSAQTLWLPLGLAAVIYHHLPSVGDYAAGTHG